MHARSLEHYSDFRNNCEKSFMRKHALKEHPQNKHEVNFKWKVLRKFKKPLQRQLFEANRINSFANNVILNSKQEFNSINMDTSNKITPTFQCNSCGALFMENHLLNNHKNNFHKQTKCKNCQYEALGLTDLKYHHMNFHRREEEK